jgi:hypothetical protein
MRRGQYYLGRVVKINLDQKQLMNAIVNAPIVNIGRFDWTITDVKDCRDDEVPYLFGKMSKYAKEGHAKVIDEIQKSQVEADVPNLLEASSPFIYLPEFSGIAFLHVWNGIEVKTFPRRFKSIVQAAFDNFFIDCDIEPISDYRAFTSKLKKLQGVTELSVTVYPPNPNFGRLWSSLNDYVETRNATKVAVKEQTSKPEGIKTNIIELMDRIMDSPDYEPQEVPAIGDAAILMAADGYGKGKVVGVENGEEVVIRTRDTQKSFLYVKEPIPKELAIETRIQFHKVNKERDMDH